MAKHSYEKWLASLLTSYKKQEKTYEELWIEFDKIIKDVCTHHRHKELLHPQDIEIFLINSILNNANNRNTKQDLDKIIKESTHETLSKIPTTFQRKLDKIPEEVIYSFQLRLFPELPAPTICISPNIQLIYDNPAASALTIRHPMSSDVFIDFNVKGCSSGSREDNATSQALIKIKNFLFASRIEGLLDNMKQHLQYANINFSTPMDLPPKTLVLKKNQEIKYEVLIDKKLYDYIDNSYPTEKLKTALHSSEKIIKIFKNVANFIDSDSKELNPIKSAMNWAIQANYSDSSTQSFLETSIAFEALFEEGTDYMYRPE